MSTFRLQILTPERLFLEDEVEALTIMTTDGEWTILSGHAAMTAPLIIGKIRIKREGVWREAFQSEGFLEIDEEGVHVFAQACEWPEEIDIRRANEAEHRAREDMRQRRSLREYERSRSALTRAMARLRITNSRINLD